MSKKLLKELIPFYSHFSATTDDFQRSYRPSKLCSDLAFWKDKCLDDSQNAALYRESRRCKTYHKHSYPIDECQDDEVYCSNKAKCLSNINECQAGLYFGNEIQCQNHSMFHCRRSNQCIWQDWVCDGFVQCLKGDDEDFDLCYGRESFPEGATFKCLEAKRFGYNVTILATKCNKIKECEDGIDEDGCGCQDRSDEADCQSNESRVLVATLVVFAVILLIWILIYYVYDNNETMDDISKEEKEHAQSAKGDTLALLKVAVESYTTTYTFVHYLFLPHRIMKILHT